VAGWEDLCELDPLAMTIWDEKKKNGDAFGQDVGRAMVMCTGLDDEDYVAPYGGFGRKMDPEDKIAAVDKSGRRTSFVGRTTPDTTINENDVAANKVEIFGQPNSILTERDSQTRRKSPACISTSTRSSSPQRKTKISAQDSSKDTDIVSASTVLELEVPKGTVQTENFDEMSTMRPSGVTEVTKSMAYRVHR
jgi:hypothetical protein